MEKKQEEAKEKQKDDKDKKPKGEEEKKEESKDTPKANDESKKKIESLQKEVEESKKECAGKSAPTPAPAPLNISRTILEIFGTVHAGRIQEKHKNIPAIDIYTPNWEKNVSYD